jgi:hypothetical protein
VPGVVAGTLAAAAVVIAVLSTVVFITSSPDRAVQGGVPAELRHAWRLPTKLVLRSAPMTAELRFYAGDSKRCADLGLGSSSCYVISGADTRLLERGTVSISEDRITFRAQQTHWCLPAGCNKSGSSSALDTPGVYGWELRDGSLRLTLESDAAADRPEVLASGPLTRVGAEAPQKTTIPEDGPRSALARSATATRSATRANGRPCRRRPPCPRMACRSTRAAPSTSFRATHGSRASRC